MQIVQVSKIPGIGQLVKVNDWPGASRYPMMHKVRANKSRTTGHENWAGKTNIVFSIGHSEESLIFRRC